MLIAQADGLELLPDVSETVWGVVSLLILAALVLAVAGAIVWVTRSSARRRELQARVEHLENNAHR